MYALERTRICVVKFAASLGLLLLACGDGEAAPVRGDVPALSAGCEGALERPLRAWEAAGFSGAVAIVQAERARCLLGFGFADRATEELNDHDTVFSIGSVSKTFTAAAVLSLSGAGVLTLSDPVARWFDDWPADKQGMTIEQLLVHTSGLGSDHGRDHVELSLEGALAAIEAQELLFEPGAGYEYSNSGYTLLAAIIEVAAGEPFRSVLEKRVTTLPGGEVLGGFWDGEPALRRQRAVGYLDDGEPGFPGRSGGNHWALDGNGSQAMSIEELARWTLALSLGAVLQAPELDTMTTPVVDLGDGFGEAPGWVALAPSALGVPALGSAGGGGDIGHNVALLWSPQAELILAIASNTPTVSAEGLLGAIAPALVAGEALPTPPEQVRLPPEVLAPLVGTYTLDAGGDLSVAAEDGGLAITAVGGAALRVLFPISDAIDPGTVLEHELAADGFFAGDTAEARAELDGLEAELGRLIDARVEASILADGELRTYLSLGFESGTYLAWVALSEQRSLMALEVGTDWPTLHLIALSDELVFVPRGAPARTPPVEVTMAEDGSELLVVGEEETLARRAAAR